MNKREAAIVTAYTGCLLGSFGDAHEYIEKIMGRPVFTHEMASKDVMNEIKEKSRDDFINLVDMEQTS